MSIFSLSMARRGVSARARSPFGIREFLALRRQRQALSELDARLLSDIGLTRYEAEVEARRKAWDVPASWRA